MGVFHLGWKAASLNWESEAPAEDAVEIWESEAPAEDVRVPANSLKTHPFDLGAAHIVHANGLLPFAIRQKLFFDFVVSSYRDGELETEEVLDLLLADGWPRETSAETAP